MARLPPYDNSTPSMLLTQNQTNVDDVIGMANYDIVHVFGTTVDGTSNRGGTVCDPAYKAQGSSGIGSSGRVGDAFDITYVAHEMGHQLRANHTFNSVAGGCQTPLCPHRLRAGLGHHDYVLRRYLLD